MSTFTETQHPRGQAGKFTTKAKPGAGVSLADPEPRPTPPTARVEEAAITAALALHRGDYELRVSEPDDDEYGRTWVHAVGEYGSGQHVQVQVAVNQDGNVGEVHAQHNLRTGKNGESVSGTSHRVLATPVEVDDLPEVMEQVVADVQTTQTQQHTIERDFNRAQDAGRLDQWEAQATAPDTVFFTRWDGRRQQA